MSDRVKDHKPVQPDGTPKTRAVVSSQNGMNFHLSNLVSQILEPLADDVGKHEGISSEDLLANIDDINIKMKDLSPEDRDNLTLI